MPTSAVPTGYLIQKEAQLARLIGALNGPRSNDLILKEMTQVVEAIATEVAKWNRQLETHNAN